jgi:hypothetical protein
VQVVLIDGKMLQKIFKGGDDVFLDILRQQARSALTLKRKQLFDSPSDES